MQDGWTPLHWCTYGNHVELARLLLDHGANPLARTRVRAAHPTALLFTPCQGNMSRYIVRFCSGKNMGRYTPEVPMLNLLCPRRQRHCCVTTVYQFTSVYAADDLFSLWQIGGFTPLHQAVYEGSDKLVHLLLEKSGPDACNIEDAVR